MYLNYFVSWFLLLIDRFTVSHEEKKNRYKFNYFNVRLILNVKLTSSSALWYWVPSLVQSGISPLIWSDIIYLLFITKYDCFIGMFISLGFVFELYFCFYNVYLPWLTELVSFDTLDIGI